jgi:hypothetical protein
VVFVSTTGEWIWSAPKMVDEPIDGTRDLPPRQLPVPDTVSPQMQAIIAKPLDPAFNIAPQTTAQWKQRVGDGARATEAI